MERSDGSVEGLNKMLESPKSFFRKLRFLLRECIQTANTADNISADNIPLKEKNVTDDSVEKTIGMTLIPDKKSNITYGIRAQYASDSTDDNPVISVTANYGGDIISRNVAVKKVDAKSATMLEMFALCSYVDDKGIREKFSKEEKSDSKKDTFKELKKYAVNVATNGQCRRVNGYEDFVIVKLDWIHIVNIMKDQFLNAGIYQKYQQCLVYMDIFEYFTLIAISESAADGSISIDAEKMLEPDETAEKPDDFAVNNSTDEPVTNDQLMRAIEDCKEEIERSVDSKVDNDSGEETFRIGEQVYTLEQWDNFIQKFDRIEDAIKELADKALQ